MPLCRADTRTDERDYYQAIPDESDDGDTPEVPLSRSNFCGTSDVQSNGANPMVGEQQQQQRRHSDTDNDNNSSSSKRARRSTLYSVTGYIIVTEFCERLAYYGFAGSLVLLFERELRMTNADADTQFALWSGVCYVMPLAGGWIADSYLGRYNAILLFSTLYLVGLVVAAASCVPGNVSPWLLFPAMYLLAVGTGGIKASVSVFGADQFDEDDPKDVEEKRSFFNWFYWSINVGALVSYTLVSYVCQFGLPFLGGPKWGFMAGYSIPCVAMAMAIVVFVAGTPKYTILPATGSVVGLAAGVVAEAACTRRGGVAGPIAGVVDSGSEGDLVKPPEGEEEERAHWLHRASEREGGSYPHDEVASVSRVWKLLPFLALQVPYWAVYAQTGTAFQNQGCQMNLAVFGFDIPVATLNIFDTLAILLLIPVFDQGVYPWMRRMGCEPTMLRKLGAGLLFAGAAVLVAAAVEVARRRGVLEGDDAIMSPCRRARDYDPAEFQDFWRTRGTAHVAERPAYCHQVEGCEDIDPDGLLSLECIECEAPPLSSDLSVLWQVPQFILVGTSEILSSVTSMEFFYAEAPSTMRGVSAGLNLCTTALGSWITMPLLGLVNSGAFGEAWVPDDLNRGHLELYFFLLAGLVAVSFATFVVVAESYRYQGVTDGSPTTSAPTERESVESGVGDNSLVMSNSGDGGDGGRSRRGEREGSARSWEEGCKLLPGAEGGKRPVSPTFGQI